MCGRFLINALPAEVAELFDVVEEPSLFPEPRFSRLDAGESGDGALLRPYPAEAMTATAVSAYLNDARHQGPECGEPAASA
jgi:putative SOS response-associated peptidase YedK